VSRTPRRLTRRIALAAVTVLGAVTLAACAGPDEQGSASQRMKAWSSSTEFGGSIATLRADSARIAQVVADRSGTGAIHADCALLLQDAGAANDNLPTPDTTVTNQLSNAYADEGSAANDCYNAGTPTPSFLPARRANGPKRMRCSPRLSSACSPSPGPRSRPPRPPIREVAASSDDRGGRAVGACGR